MLAGRDTDAWAINDSGVVVGGSGGHAVWWDLSGQIHDLGVGQAHGINAQGQIAGTDGVNPVIWNPDGSVSILPKMDADCGYASDINDNGWIVGSIGRANIGAQAVLWQPVPEPSSLLALAGGVPQAAEELGHQE